MEKYAVLNGEVVSARTGKKVRGTFRIVYHKSKISIYKVGKKKDKFVGFANKMKPKVEQRAKKLQDIRIKKEENKKIKESQKLNQSKTNDDEELRKWREKLLNSNIPLESESVSSIEEARRAGAFNDVDLKSGQFAPLNFSKEQQSFYNFNRIITKMRQHEAIDLNKIENAIKNFYDMDDNELSLKGLKFNTPEEFLNWLYESYRDGDKDKRTALWNLLHSLESESGFTYNPVEL